MKRIELELALLETVSALAVLLDGLGTPLGHAEYLAEARGRLVEAMKLLGADDDGTTRTEER